MPHSTKIFDRQVVTARREKALAQIDYPDFLDELIARELVSRLDLIARDFSRCVIVGQPAPVFLEIIKSSPKLANVIAWQGVQGSGNMVFDSEWLPFKDNSLDCVIAGPGLEQVNDLPGTLIQINRALKPDGLFLGAMFGGLTLFELRHAWVLAEEQLGHGVSPRVAPFIDVRQAGNLLQRAGLALPVADADILTVRYDNAFALMKEVRKMGFSSGLMQRSNRFVSQRLLDLVEDCYNREFSDPDGRIRACVEINYLTAWCPHESQQKPLKPGSAQKNLAEILTPEKSGD